MLKGRAIPEETLGEIEKLFRNGTVASVSFTLIPVVSSVCLFITALIVDSKRSFPTFSVEILNVLTSFGVAYAAVAVGLLIAGFSIIAGSLESRLTLTLSRMPDKTKSSNILAFMYSIFVSALLVYWRLFAASFIGLILAGDGRFLLDTKESAVALANYNAYLLAACTLLGVFTYIVVRSLLFLKTFIKNLHATLALIAEVQVEIGNQDEAARQGDVS
ncbi:hypothetical protein [Sulfitobacter pontiacus]|uniref:hypothetical protein n=1 Tax=Sulfitobacter pontiacus TaxID=60137 RepID=UPI0030EB5E1A